MSIEACLEGVAFGSSVSIAQGTFQCSEWKQE